MSRRRGASGRAAGALLAQRIVRSETRLLPVRHLAGALGSAALLPDDRTLPREHRGHSRREETGSSAAQLRALRPIAPLGWGVDCCFGTWEEVMVPGKLAALSASR